MQNEASPLSQGARPPAGVVVLGGAHGTLALARSLGALGVPVWLISNDTSLPAWSRHVRRRLTWAGAEDRNAVEFLLSAAVEHGLEGWLLVAAGDAEVRFLSCSIEQLSPVFRILLPPWRDLQWVCDKPLLYRRAAELGVDIPPTYELDRVPATELKMRFPVVLKPNMGGGQNAFSRAKAVRADDPEGFVKCYREAAEQIGRDNVVVQEIIPGGGECQFSYAALWVGGSPVAEFTARRTRQYPVDFGYTSTYVEIVHEPALIEAARRLLGSIRHSGLVEVEFKRDPRDGRLRLLDVNPRPWSWFGLASASGVDLGALLWAAATGRPLPEAATAPRNAAWMYLARDIVAAARLIGSGRLRIEDYFRSFASVRAWATFSATDIGPGLIDLPLTVWRVLTRRVLKFR